MQGSASLSPPASLTGAPFPLSLSQAPFPHPASLTGAPFPHSLSQAPFPLSLSQAPFPHPASFTGASFSLTGASHSPKVCIQDAGLNLLVFGAAKLPVAYIHVKCCWLRLHLLQSLTALSLASQPGAPYSSAQPTQPLTSLSASQPTQPFATIATKTAQPLAP